VSGLFNGTSGYLVNSAPGLATTGYPLTVGSWINPTLPASFSHFMMFSNFTTAGHRFTLRLSSAGILDMITNDTGSGALASTTTGIASNQWVYVLARWINSTNRRLSVLFANGSTQHAQNTTSKAPTGMNSFSFGTEYDASPSFFYTGSIAKPWYADADIQADGGALPDAMLRQIAYHGPFSVPYFRKSIVEYHEMRSSVPNVRNMPDEHYLRGPASAGIWSNVGGVSIAKSVPLPASHEGPYSRVSTVIV
jgi:hypothetical protein